MSQTTAKIQHVPVAPLPWERFREVLDVDHAEALEHTVARAPGGDRGGPEFFCVTKRIHNRLHGAIGDGGPLASAELAVYQEAMDRNLRARDTLMRTGDIGLLHDPQTAGLAGAAAGSRRARRLALRQAGQAIEQPCMRGVTVRFSPGA